MMAPLGLFAPEMFGITDADAVQKPKRFYSDPQDPFDGDYLEQVQRVCFFFTINSCCFVKGLVYVNL